jgi:hypothetical protein
MSATPSACEQLAQSRERLRQALHEAQSPPEDRRSPSSGEASTTDLLRDLRALPGANLLLDIVLGWWDKQPLRVGLLLAAEAAQVVLEPLARRHPYKLVAGAFAIGAVLTLTRPWRWVSTPALLAGLLPQLLPELMKHLRPPHRADVTKRP